MKDPFIAIPHGIKCFLWFTCFKDQNICLMLEIDENNKNNKTQAKKINNVSLITLSFSDTLSFNSILYGTLFISENKKIMTIEDIFYYKGKNISKIHYENRFVYLKSFFENDILYENYGKNSIYIKLCIISVIFQDFLETLDKVNYKIKYINYRYIKSKKSFHLKYNKNTIRNADIVSINNFNNNTHNNFNNNTHNNFNNNTHNNFNNNTHNNFNNNTHNNTHNNFNNNTNTNKNFTSNSSNHKNNYNIITNNKINDNCNKYTKMNVFSKEKHFYSKKNQFNKTQANTNKIFKIKADIQNDIYNIITTENNCEKIQDTICIPDYKTSIFMNKLFRNIKENENLDLLEESDDEEDFENSNPEKYVFLEKSYNIECNYSIKFNKWIPIKVVT